MLSGVPPQDPAKQDGAQNIGPVPIWLIRRVVHEQTDVIAVVGIDLGVANFLADPDGEFVPDPLHGRKAAAKLEAAQRDLSRFPSGRLGRWIASPPLPRGLSASRHA